MSPTMAASVMSLQVMMVGTPDLRWGELRSVVLPALLVLLLVDLALLLVAAAPGALRAASRKESRLPLLALVASLQVMMVGTPENPPLPVYADELFGVTWRDLCARAVALLAMLLVLDVVAIAATSLPTAARADVRQAEAQAEDDASQECFMPTKVDRSRCWSESTAATESPMDESSA